MRYPSRSQPACRIRILVKSTCLLTPVSQGKDMRDLRKSFIVVSKWFYLDMLILYIKFPYRYIL